MFRLRALSVSCRDFLALSALVLLPLSLVAQSGQLHVYKQPKRKPSKGVVQMDAELPVASAHIYLFAVGTNGPNTGAVSLLNGSGVQYDALGGYVVTDSGGNFNLSGLYASNCPSPDPNVYLMAVGGGTGGTGNNPSIMEVSAMPVTCSNLPNVSSVFISERTTIAAAFALAGFVDVVDDQLSSSSSAVAVVAQAFAYSNSLVDGLTGNVVSSANTTNINTLADILSYCVDSSGGSNCPNLFSYTTMPGVRNPSNIWEASLSMAVYPTNNTASEYYLVSANAPYQPSYPQAPTTWMMNVSGAPIITGITSDLGSGGTTMTITGTGFGTSASAINVIIGGAQATILTISDAQITASIPANANGLATQLYNANNGSNPFGPVQINTNTTVSLPTPQVSAGTAFNVVASVSTNTSARPTGAVQCTGSNSSGFSVSHTGTLAAGTATITFPVSDNVPAGSLNVSCNYLGTTLYAKSSSGTAVETILPPLIPVTVAVSGGGSGVYGDNAQFTITVSGQSSIYSPTGTVTVSESGTTLGTATLQATVAGSTQWSFKFANLSIASHTLTFTYSGNTYFQPGSGSASQTVTGQTGLCAP